MYVDTVTWLLCDRNGAGKRTEKKEGKLFKLAADKFVGPRGLKNTVCNKFVNLFSSQTHTSNRLKITWTVMTKQKSLNMMLKGFFQ